MERTVLAAVVEGLPADAVLHWSAEEMERLTGHRVAVVLAGSRDALLGVVVEKAG